MTPLRQFKGVPPEVVRKAEGKQFVSFYDISTLRVADCSIPALVPLF
jgi:pre-mRNA-splicing helicase BRR2